jgi:uncharacterized damage-inducible protein DinB
MLESQREAVPRNDGGELDTALAFLDFARSCVLKKLDGLDEEQVRRRHVVSDTTLLGLVQHLVDAERHWLGYMFGGQDEYADLEYSMVVAPEVPTGEVVASYRAAIADSNALIASVGDPDAGTVRLVGDRPQTLRWVLAHLTSETARHAGHADILRELTDEITGR